MLDFDRLGLSQTVTAQTPLGTVLDAPRSFGGATLWNGAWVVYTICGGVDFVFTNVSGSDAVVSGVFFGPPPANPTAATNLLVDTAGCASCGAGLSQVVAETDGSGNVTALYVRAGDELLEVMRPGSTPATWTTRFVHHDDLGSVRALTDESGTTTDTRGYEAFGTKNVHAGSDPLTYGFAGEPFQADSMLAYHRARWLDARVGRFAGMDSVHGTMRSPLSLHRYLYVSDSPSNRTDPSGNLDAGISFQWIFDSLAGLAGRNVKGQPYIDVRATSVAFFWNHLFLIVGDGRGTGDETIFRGGPTAHPVGSLTSPNGDNPPDPADNFYGLIHVEGHKYEPSYADWDTNAPSVEVASGPSVPEIAKCFDNEMSRINDRELSYWPLGPNSNTVVSTMLVRCHLPVITPENVIAPGFNYGTL